MMPKDGERGDGRKGDSPSVEIVDSRSFGVDGLALIERSGSVWRTFSRPWWDLSSWLWWWLMPGVKKFVLLRKSNGRKVRVRAVRVSKRHVYIGSVQEPP